MVSPNPPGWAFVGPHWPTPVAEPAGAEPGFWRLVPPRRGRVHLGRWRQGDAARVRPLAGRRRSRRQRVRGSMGERHFCEVRLSHPCLRARAAVSAADRAAFRAQSAHHGAPVRAFGAQRARACQPRADSTSHVRNRAGEDIVIELRGASERRLSRSGRAPATAATHDPTVVFDFVWEHWHLRGLTHSLATAEPTPGARATARQSGRVGSELRAPPSQDWPGTCAGKITPRATGKPTLPPRARSRLTKPGMF
jgi:hypothetical protein